MEETNVLGGWPVSELMKISKVIGFRHRLAPVDQEEATSLALVAIVELCMTAGTRPEAHELFWAGRSAISLAARQERKHHGYYMNANVGPGERAKVTRRFAAYWDDPETAFGEFEETLVERLAVRQVYAALSPRQRMFLDALVTAGTYAGAAALVGMTKSGYHVGLNRARAVARRHWNYPDPPVQMWGRDRAGKATPAVTVMEYIRLRKRARRRAAGGG